MEQVFEIFETSDIYTATTSAPNMIEFFLTETLETPFAIRMVPTSDTAHRNIQAIRINTDNNTNQETSHLYT